MKNIGIIGYGRFGKILYDILKNDFNIFVVDKKLKDKIISNPEKIGLCEAFFAYR